MARISLDAELAPATGQAGQYALQAIRLWRAGDRTAAEQAYQRAHTAPAPAASTSANLALFNLLRNQPAAALTKARRAVADDPRCLAGWINLSVAALQADDGAALLDAAQRAVAVAPQHAKALFNLGRALAAQGQGEAATEMLERAAALCPQDGNIQLELARVARTRQDRAATRRHALRALALATERLPAKLVLQPPKPSLDVTAAGDALCAAGAVLDAAGIGFFLMAGTLLALVRDGDLLPHDKDIDLGLPEGNDPERIAAVFAAHPEFTVPPRPASTEPLPAYGVIHGPSGIAIDLFFPRAEPSGLRFGFGRAPEIIECVVRPFELGSLRWRERDWAIPNPPGQYLQDIYGPNWRTPDRYFDTVLSNSCRSPTSLPLAINLGLLRLADSLGQQDWARAHALCQQLLAREALPEVGGLKRALEARCPDLPR